MTMRDVGGADDVDFVLADADGLDEDDVCLPAASSTSAASPVARASPPRLPRVAMLRMKTPASADVRLHADAIAQNRAAGERARRIDRDDADRLVAPRAARRSADRRACSCRRPAAR